jgi:hypothetical protein
LDRAEALAERVKVDGLVIRGPNGLKSHPCIREELAARALSARLLMRLGLNYEPLREHNGRPPKA